MAGDDDDRSEYGAPAVGAVVRDRFGTDEVYQRIIVAADEEIEVGDRELFFSGVAAGLAITITYLVYAALTAKTGADPITSALLYPMGFLYIVLGGYQLYTENTLPPVALVLERLASVPALLRTWTIVLAGNFAGGGFGAAVLAYTGAMSGETRLAAVDLARKGVETAPFDLFVKAAFAGLVVAGVVWLDYTATDTTSRVMLVYLAFLVIPFADLFHVVVSFTEATFLVLTGRVGLLASMGEFVLPVLVGNTVGGVLFVTIINYFQTSERRLESIRERGMERRLSVREWLFGGFVGRSYVPTRHGGRPPEDD